ncbi:MAG: YHYH protein [Aquihabitans sp.]
MTHPSTNRILIRRLAAAATGVLLVTGVFACGSSGSDSASDTTTTAAEATTTADADGGVAAGPTTIPVDDIETSTVDDQTVGMPKSSLDLTKLPLGNQHQTTEGAEKGYVYACRERQGGPPVTIPPWVDEEAGTWNAVEKLASGGEVEWPSEFEHTTTDDGVELKGNNLPPRSGTFPVEETDPSYAWNPNPGSIEAKEYDVTITDSPELNDEPSCIGGNVGIAADGVILLDAMDAGGYDAGAVEVQDTCHGHPNGGTGYHHHSLSPCWLSDEARTETTQVGWAMDGFGLYVEYDDDGNLLTNDDLDACHGRTSTVPWNGEMVEIYHYSLTYEYPYTVGCFMGTPATMPGAPGAGPGGGPVN